MSGRRGCQKLSAKALKPTREAFSGRLGLVPFGSRRFSQAGWPLLDIKGVVLGTDGGRYAKAVQHHRWPGQGNILHEEAGGGRQEGEDATRPGAGFVRPVRLGAGMSATEPSAMKGADQAPSSCWIRPALVDPAAGTKESGSCDHSCPSGAAL